VSIMSPEEQTFLNSRWHRAAADESCVAAHVMIVVG
jgi:hypothetical protein